MNFRSAPTHCLGCHLTVQLITEDPKAPGGAWECPVCKKRYLFTHWRIKTARKQDQLKREGSAPEKGL
jgi:hypothetical protein